MGKIYIHKQAGKSGNKYFRNTKVKVPYKFNNTFPENVKYPKSNKINKKLRPMKDKCRISEQLHI
jgi:hypothetical protein